MATWGWGSGVDGEQQFGAVAVPIVTIYRRHEVEFICRQSSVHLLVVAYDADGNAPDFAREVAVDGMDVVAVTVGSAEPFGMISATGKPEPGLNVIVYTSGTESNPKGVRHNAESLLYDSVSMTEFLGLGAADGFFMPSPLAHITGLLNDIITPVLLGATTVLMQRWNAQRALCPR